MIVTRWARFFLRPTAEHPPDFSRQFISCKMQFIMLVSGLSTYFERTQNIVFEEDGAH